MPDRLETAQHYRQRAVELRRQAQMAVTKRLSGREWPRVDLKNVALLARHSPFPRRARQRSWKAPVRVTRERKTGTQGSGRSARDVGKGSLADRRSIP